MWVPFNWPFWCFHDVWLWWWYIPIWSLFNTFLSIWSWSWWFMNRTFVAPLERIKLECIIQGSKYTWFRTIQSIWAREGLMGFWKGNVLNLFRTVPFKCINFISYDITVLDCCESEEPKRSPIMIDSLGVASQALQLPFSASHWTLWAYSMLNLFPIMSCHDMTDQWSKS